MPGDVTKLLIDWKGGDKDALDRLAPMIYTELRRLARIHLRKDRAQRGISTTELVHELYLRLAGSNTPVWENRTHFYAIAARLMRQILVDYAREQGAVKRGSGKENIPLENVRGLSDSYAREVVALHDALDELSKFDERKTKMLELRYFAGLSNSQIAAILAISDSTLTRELRAANAWLKKYLT